MIDITAAQCSSLSLKKKKEEKKKLVEGYSDSEHKTAIWW